MAEQAHLWLALVAILVFAILTWRSPTAKHGLKLPPGPRPLPVLGNLLDFPPKGALEAQHWLKHMNAFGPLTSVSTFGNTIVVSHDRDLTYTLMEKRAAKTMLRPGALFADEMCGYNLLTGSNNDGGSDARHRHKLMLRHFATKTKVAEMSETIGAEVNRCLVRLLDEPQGLQEHLRTYVAREHIHSPSIRVEILMNWDSETGSLILKMVYGYSIRRHGVDPLIAMVEQVTGNFSVAFLPFSWMVDIIPSIRHLPEWLPGMSFKSTARAFRKLNQAVCNVPYEFVLRNMADGHAFPSFVAAATAEDGIPSDRKHLSDKDEHIKGSAASIYAAGSDTLVSSLSAFFLAMIIHPDVKHKAQAEIDSVIGSDRLPNLSDADRLPYVNALVQELHRWNSAVPMGLPHRADEDMELAGYLIPKGAILLNAIWWFSHDPDTYPNPDSYEPERFLEPRHEPDPRVYNFGFGRRRCPGQFIADALLFLHIARVLAIFDIRGSPDQTLPRLDPSPGVLSHPKPFKHSITPRSERHKELLRRVTGNQRREKSDEHLLDIPDGLEVKWHL
jgi:fumagillin biosynthesis cytochrome P450 monooxygenase